MEKSAFDMIQTLRRLWQKRKFILYVLLGFLAVGLFIAFFSPKKYRASCTFVTQSNTRAASSSLSALASLTGVSLGDASLNNLSPRVYPKVIQNVNFQKEMMQVMVTTARADHPVPLLDYMTDEQYQPFNLIALIKKYTLGLPRVILNLFHKKDGNIGAASLPADSEILSLTKKEYAFVSRLGKTLKMELNTKEGYITLSAQLPEAIAVTEVVQAAFNLMEKYVTEFKIQKLQDNLAFVQDRFDEARLNFEAKQLQYAEFQDANRKLSSAVASIREEKLRSDYNLANSLYMELARQLLQVNLEVKEDTPILTAINPPVVPLKKSSPHRSMILFVFFMLGLIVSCGSVLFLDNLKQKGVERLVNW